MSKQVETVRMRFLCNGRLGYTVRGRLEAMAKRADIPLEGFLEMPFADFAQLVADTMGDPKEKGDASN